MTTIYDECSKEELLQIVSEMQKDLNDSKKEIERLTELIDIKDDACIDLVEEIKELQRKFDDTTNDYKLASYEISVLNKYIGKLTTENNDLKYRRKIFVKHLLNIMYGFDYADTDSIKETKDNDNNN